MLPWWGWLLLWVVLVAASAALLAWRGWLVWGEVKALSREVGEAERTLTALEVQRDRLATAGEALDRELAVLRDPAEVGRERAATRQALSDQRHERARARRPAWARSVD